MNREIPGFYYDPEKKKYFRIQASHKAAPGAQYSKDAVKRKREEQEKHTRKHRQNTRLSKEKIKKAHFLHHPLIGCERELGGTQKIPKPARREQQGLVYTSQLRRREVHRFAPWPDEYSIKHVVRSQRSGALVASGYRGGESSVSVCFPDLDQGEWAYNRTMERALFKEPYRLSSISLSPTGYLLYVPTPFTYSKIILTETSTTMDSGPNGDSFLAPRLLPDPDEGGDYRWPSSLTHPIRIRTTTSLWSSAACPKTTNPKPLFAIGTSNGLHTLTGLGSHWAFNKVPLPMPDPIDIPPYIPGRDRGRGWGRGKFHHTHNRSHRPTNTVTSVEWLSDEVIAAGLKDSTVFLHDVRSGGSALRLRHNGPVARICKVDEWRVVVGGVHSVSPPYILIYLQWFGVSVCANANDKKLQMYDLRYPPTKSNPNPNSKGNKNYNRHASTTSSTKPYLVFQDYSPVNINPEFDLNSELNILANASDEHTIQLFSLRTGEQVSSSPSPLSRYRYPKGISSVCFEPGGGEEGIQGPQTPGLLVCSGDGVDEWRW